jgi:hypothetical protein
MLVPYLAILLLSGAAAGADPMIAVEPDGGVATPILGPDGEPLRAYPVRYARDSSGETSLELIDISSDCESDAANRGSCFRSRGPIVRIGGETLTGPELTAGFGWVFGRGTQDALSERSGLVLQGSLGTAGAKAGVGYLSEIFLLFYPVGFDVKAALFRSWGGARQEHGAATYVGGEADLLLFGATLTLGLYRRVAGVSDADDWRVNFGAGFGF